MTSDNNQMYPNTEEMVEEPNEGFTKGHIEALQMENERLRTELVGFLQHDDEVPEKAMKNDFEQIGFAIENWVDEVCLDQKKEFGDLLRRRLGDPTVVRRFERIRFDLHKLEWFSRIGTCHLLILSVLIWNHLEEYVFHRSFPIGLSNTHRSTIDTVQKVMIQTRSQDGVQDTGRIRKWKSEALLALCSEPSFAASQAERCKSIGNQLRSFLEKWTGSSMTTRFWPRMERDILEPAVRLQQVLRCSINNYELYYPNILESQRSRAAAYCQYKRFDNWVGLDFKNVDSTIQLLSPALIREDNPLEEPTVLAKAVVIASKRASANRTSPERHPTFAELPPTLSSKSPNPRRQSMMEKIAQKSGFKPRGSKTFPTEQRRSSTREASTNRSRQSSRQRSPGNAPKRALTEPLSQERSDTGSSHSKASDSVHHETRTIYRYGQRDEASVVYLTPPSTADYHVGTFEYKRNPPPPGQN